MKDDAGVVIRDLVVRLWALPVEDYLASPEFSRFASEHAIHDAWRAHLRLAEDRPDMYGGSVVRNAFTLFLSHIFNRRREEFLFLFSGMMADFARGISCTLPVDEIKPFLLLLGFPEGEADHALFSLRILQVPVRETDITCCPAQKKNSRQ